MEIINNLKDTIEKRSITVEHYGKEMGLMRKQFEAKDEVNRMLANERSPISSFSLRTTGNTVSGVHPSKESC